MASTGNPSDGYWNDYNNLQFIKHKLLQRYLGAWYPILTQGGYPDVAYIETHAGRGRHLGGQAGSPLVALQTLLNHAKRDQMLARSNVRFRFIELDEENAKHLRAELSSLGPLPSKIDVEVITQDYEQVLDRLLMHTNLHAGVPILMFVDPFGYRLPIEKLRLIREQSQCELLVNFMWRYVDMALQDHTKAQHMESLFGSEWQTIVEIKDPEERCDTAVTQLATRLGAKHHIAVRMLGETYTPKYILIHAADSLKAFEVMKDALWSIVPEGDFRVRQTDDPKQEFLLRAQPDLRPLARILWDRLEGKSAEVIEIHEIVKRSIYRLPQANELLKEWVKARQCELPDGKTRLVLKDNPRLRFCSRPLGL